MDYKSSFEVGIAKNLSKRGVPFEYEKVKLNYWMKVYQAKCRTCSGLDVGSLHVYTPDFHLTKPNIFIEAKGKLDSKTRTKMIAVKANNPDRDIRFLFMYDNWITKKHRARYSDWCRKYNFLYAFKEVPQEWII